MVWKKILYRQLSLEVGIDDYEIFMHSHLTGTFRPSVKFCNLGQCVFLCECTETAHINTKHLFPEQSPHSIL